MIKIGKFTGVVEDEYVEVLLDFDVKRLCKPVMPFPIVGRPYPTWITDNKDKFQAVVSFEDEEHNDREKALLIGYYPLKNNNFPTEGLDDFWYLYSKFLRMYADEAARKLIFDYLHANSKVEFGKGGTEPAILGNKLKAHLDDLCDKGQALAQAAGQITVNTAVGPSSVPVNLASFTQLATDFATIKAALGDILSTRVFLKE